MSLEPNDRSTPAASERPPTALPSVTARALGFVAIVVSGAIGAFIGWGFTDLQCRGDCGTPDAIGALVGALIGAGGVAVVVVLALRAMGEWRTVQRRPTGPERPAIPPAKRPRVR
jgi:uncharacterized membrane protein YeaQ/YmgE (transglycosylase-associated protein family)